MTLFNLYLSKLNKDFNHFWQKPKKRVHYTNPVWYHDLIVGHYPLESFMKLLCPKVPNLSRRDYTNHSIRYTVMEILDEQFEARHNMAVSGHKSESTIKNYAKRCSPKKKRGEMSKTLEDKIIPEKRKKHRAYHSWQLVFRDLADFTLKSSRFHP